MNLARGIEKRLENLVDGASASVFRGKMHPVTIASRVIRQLEFLIEETPSGPESPNDLTVVINTADLDTTISVPELEAELQAIVENAAIENGWRLVGPVSVHFEASPDVPRGILQCAGSVIPGKTAAWAQMISVDGSAVIPLTLNRTLIGRGLACDIRLSNEEISREHALVVRKSETVSITDLGSSNGTWVNGDRIARKPVPLVPGTSITLGDLAFTFRTVA